MRTVSPEEIERRWTCAVLERLAQILLESWPLYRNLVFLAKARRPLSISKARPLLL